MIDCGYCANIDKCRFPFIVAPNDCEDFENFEDFDGIEREEYNSCKEENEEGK